MQHDEKPLPVDIRTLGMIAERCRAYAKALHYKETEFISNPAACVEAIIAINNQLQLPEAAMGVLVYAQAHLRLEIKEGWYEKLGQWDNALEAYRRKAVAADAARAKPTPPSPPRRDTTATPRARGIPRSTSTRSRGGGGLLARSRSAPPPTGYPTRPTRRRRRRAKIRRRENVPARILPTRLLPSRLWF